MNSTFLFKKAATAFFILSFVVSLSFVEANRSLHVKKTKTLIVPKTRLVTVGSNHATYARRYSYGRPIPNYSTKGKIRTNRRYYGGRRNGKRDGSRTYASGYRNWTPNRHFPGGRNIPRADTIKKGPQRKKPGAIIKEPNFNPIKQKRRIRPQRPAPLQRPLPPKKLTDFDEDYFFPEEAKKAETKYEFESRFPRPKKKRRNPGEQEKIPKKPETYLKIPYYDDKPLSSYKPKTREPPISYSTFVQHPSSSGSDDESYDYYSESENSDYSQPPIRTKKKRVKKKSNSKKKNKYEDHFRPFSFEDDTKIESFPPVYLNSDEYDHSVKSVKKPSKIKPSQEVLDDDYSSQKSIYYSKPRPQISSVFSSSLSDGYRGSQSSKESSQFNPSYSQPWSHSNVVETTARPVSFKTENGFQPQYVPNQYNYQQNRDYTSLQKTKTVTTNTQQSSYYSQPDNSYKSVAYSNNYVSNHASATNTNAQTPSNYNYNSYNSVYSTQSSPTYNQPIPSSSSYYSDITVQKSVPIYDNTETFYSFNNNAYVNAQPSKHNADLSQKYSSRLSNSNISFKTNGGTEKSDADNEFIKKHQNLYNNGLSGVPIQGDGYGKDSKDAKKDYDIGYGDFQFDENPSS